MGLKLFTDIDADQMLEQKTIVIIGGTSGMGFSASRAFAKAGARVVAVGADEDSCAHTKARVGERVSVLCGDARDPATATKAIERALDQFGGFDGLYHVAGGSGRKWGDGPLHDIPLEGWNQTLELNLTSVMLSNQAAVRTFRERKTPGAILNLTSVLAFSPSARYFYTHAYAAAKSAIIGFSKSIAAYYAEDDIRVNVLAPAFTITPMSRRAQAREDIRTFLQTKQPLRGGGPATPTDLDGLACYFMSDQSSFTTGQVISVDGGWSISEGQVGEVGRRKGEGEKGESEVGRRKGEGGKGKGVDRNRS